MENNDLTCNDLEAIAISTLRFKQNLLCNFDDSGMNPVSEQHFLLALDYLDQAVRNIKLAHYHQIRKV